MVAQSTQLLVHPQMTISRRLLTSTQKAAADWKAMHFTQPHGPPPSTTKQPCDKSWAYTKKVNQASRLSPTL